jgi:hypothetical protein
MVGNRQRVREDPGTAPVTRITGHGRVAIKQTVQVDPQFSLWLAVALPVERLAYQGLDLVEAAQGFSAGLRAAKGKVQLISSRSVSCWF